MQKIYTLANIPQNRNPMKLSRHTGFVFLSTCNCQGIRHSHRPPASLASWLSGGGGGGGGGGGNGGGGRWRGAVPRPAVSSVYEVCHQG